MLEMILVNGNYHGKHEEMARAIYSGYATDVQGLKIQDGLQSVHKTVGDTSTPCPWVDVRTLLACSHVPNTTLMPQVTHLGFVTARWAVLQHNNITNSLEKSHAQAPLIRTLYLNIYWPQ